MTIDRLSNGLKSGPGFVRQLHLFCGQDDQNWLPKFFADFAPLNRMTASVADDYISL
jgi:hypothetical protein